MGLLGELEKENIKKTIGVMSEEELKEVVKAIPAKFMFEELISRYEDHLTTLNGICSHFKIDNNFK